MKLHRLRVENFAGIREGIVEFGPGLNVLYGPNDLGKSTLADAIRLALLLPHSSTDCKPYIPWTGGADPLVEITFSTEAQRIWRVRKTYGKGGSSVLEESRNGRDFDEVERARRVDARVRELLGWGIPEPTAAGKGLPTSYLATALLSTQADVTAVLRESLEGDPTGTGKDRIAAALQAVAQDPLFLALLRETQARRDDAYTDKGSRKTAKGSVFKEAADQLKLARDEKERLEKIVEESTGVEQYLRDLMGTRDTREQARIDAAEHLAKVAALTQQAADRLAASECVRTAADTVRRIQQMDRDVEGAERRLVELAAAKGRATEALQGARAAEEQAAAGLKTAEEAARAAGSDQGTADTLARQGLGLRKAAAEQSATAAQQHLDAAVAAQKLTVAADQAAREHREQEAEAARVQGQLSKARDEESAANERVARCELLERGLDARVANARVVEARNDVKTRSSLQAELATKVGERAAGAARRAALHVPDESELPTLRKLGTELEGARGALNVGFLLTVLPTAPIALRVRRDGVVADPGVIADAHEIEAAGEVELGIGDVATVRIKGGRKDARDRVRALEQRWEREVQPRLDAAGVDDLEALAQKVAEARDLDAVIKKLDGEQKALEDRIAALASASDVLREASARAAAFRVALGDVTVESIADELDALGADPTAALRIQRQEAAETVAGARKSASEVATKGALAVERAHVLKAALDAAVAARDAALLPFPTGVEAIAAKAQADLAAARAEQEKVGQELTALQATIEQRARRHDDALVTAGKAVETARGAVAAAEAALVAAIAEHAEESGRLVELRKLRAGEDLAAAETTLNVASEREAGLPVPDRAVAPGELADAQAALTRAVRDLEMTEAEIHRKQGALEQVGGAVAQERLRDAIEAFEQAERHERETEADYEAWKLLLEQMKEADAAQASNLGQAMAPALTAQFQALTAQRYQSVQLTAQLGTEGVMVGGAVRDPERISVGTREQLSTLYRLCLGQYLQTAIVLDDQLVQSDGTRMDWFRTLLGEKARVFQIIVFTCRPKDYLADAAMPDGDAHADTEDGFVRALDLRRALKCP